MSDQPNNPKNLIIIGNGYDLNLGLPTRYIDFIESKYFDNLVADETSLCKYLKRQTRLQNWIDIENELKKYSLESPRGGDRFYKEYLALCEALTNYLNNLDYSLIDEHSFAYDFTRGVLQNKNSLIVNFNYTESIRSVASKLKLSPCEIINVHGSAKNKNIIFGVEDNADINVEDIFLLKTASPFYQSIHLGKLLDDASLIIFFGHSLGETDHHYFRSFLSTITHSQSRKRGIALIHYTEVGRLQLMKQIRVLTNNYCAELFDNNLVTFHDTTKIKPELPVIE